MVQIGLLKDVKHWNEIFTRVKSAVELASKSEGTDVGQSMSTITERLPGSPTLVQVVSIGRVPMISRILSRSVQDATRLRTRTTIQSAEDFSIFPADWDYFRVFLRDFTDRS